MKLLHILLVMTKTVFCDIDGTLLLHKGDIVNQIKMKPEILPGVLVKNKEWEKLNYKIILTTGRKESTREQTVKQLAEIGIIYDNLIMGLPNGERILINDKKTNGIENTAFAVNVVRNKGIENIDITSNQIPVSNSIIFDKIEKPWGYEKLIECNDKYVVKELFMKKNHACSIQYHELKTETILVLSGKLNIYIGDSLETLQCKEFNTGETITIKPYTIHRMEAIEDTIYFETSTNELWDVIRIQDNYGRS